MEPARVWQFSRVLICLLLVSVIETFISLCLTICLMVLGQFFVIKLLGAVFGFFAVFACSFASCSIPIAQSHTMQHPDCTVTHHAACPLHSHTPCSMPIAQSHTMQHAHRTVTHHAACLLARFALFCNDLTKMFNTILLDGCRYPANPAICKYAPRILSEPPRPSLPTTCCFLARDHTCEICPDHWFSPHFSLFSCFPVQIHPSAPM